MPALLRKRLSNAEIASQLAVSVNTVRTHVSNILSKLDLADRHAVACWPGMPGVWRIREFTLGRRE